MDPIILNAQEIHIPEQKYFEGVGHFPYVFGSTDTAVTIREAVDWVKFNKKHIESILLKHGAILFRGFPTNDAVAFNEFILAFGYENLPYIGGAAPRKQVVGDVFTANEAPPEANIPFHHEMATVKNWPKKLFFYGDVCPEIGGETPVVLSNEVYKRMVAKHPAFMEKLEKLGLKYTRILPEENDETSPQGRGWKATYGVNTKEELLVKLAERKVDYEWLPNGELKTVSREPLSGVDVDPRTGLKVFFNSIVAVYTGWNDSRHVGEKCVHFGDGSPLDKEAVLSCRDIMDEICVNHKWQHGDVIMIDNRVAMHARRPFVGQRKIYAYLTQT
jgi:alpha-ketoglutarate-dependent taurine dioxygenase